MVSNHCTSDNGVGAYVAAKVAESFMYFVRRTRPRPSMSWWLISRGLPDLQPMSATPLSTSQHPWSAAKVRSTFIEFFEDKKHHFVPSSAVLPHDDPTLMFVNSGMCQFKPIFLGTINPNTPMSKLTRAANSQKCIRAGGKHNDLDDVGKDTYHHTFFEMLGNWSFGDYFKKEAIDWAFRLLTEVYGLDRNRMYATYFEGNPDANLAPDLEAKALWESFLPADHVIPGNMKDNFWEMGPVGPCGPCSEVHYDRIGGRNAASRVNQDDPNVIEIWNLVFMQFSRENDGSLRPLPNKHIDTGMGFERLVSILQDKRSNYDTDVFMPLFEAIQASKTKTPLPPYGGKLGKEDVDGIDMAYRVIADHIRTVSVAIADGIRPGNDGRQYVVRRILRRAIRYGRTFLQAETGFLHQLVDTVALNMGDAFPELRKHKDKIKSTILDEELAFDKTLDRGTVIYKKIVEEMKSNSQTKLSGKDMFLLYSTYGFPDDLTKIMATEDGLDVDEKEFKHELEISKRSIVAKGSDEIKFEAEQVAALKSSKVQPTDDNAKYAWNELCSATIRAIYSQKKFVNKIDDSKETVAIILDNTSFYAESGGQVNDTGKILKGRSESFDVSDCQTYGGYVLHIGKLVGGSFAVGDKVDVSVDYQRRAQIAPNHTCTHMLNFALWKILGKGLDQMGSLVDEDKLRYDFSYGKALTPKEVADVQDVVSDQIRKCLDVYTLVAPLEKAKKIRSLRAVFGEIYPDPVRVVSVGQDVRVMLDDPENPDWDNYSVEFCGGTHLQNTKQAADFVIVNEFGLSQGVRRLIAFTGSGAQSAISLGQELKSRLSELEESKSADLKKELSSLRTEIDKMKSSLPYSDKVELDTRVEKMAKLLHKMNKKDTTSAVAETLQTIVKRATDGEEVIVMEIDAGGDTKALKDCASKAFESFPNLAVFLFSIDESKGKVMALSAVSGSLDSKKFSSATWLQQTLSKFGGKGGGKQFAQGQVDLNNFSLQDATNHALEVSKSLRK
jgi:alanyl-tRNA synthetase